MPRFTSKQQVEQALERAKRKAVEVRVRHGTGAKFDDAVVDCNNLQKILDRWDDLHRQD